MTWTDLRDDIVDDFAEAQRKAVRAASVCAGIVDGEVLSLARRRRRELPLSRLELALLVELRKDPRVARAGRALCLGSRVTRKTAEGLVEKRLVRLEHLKNKRKTLVARVSRPSFYE